VTIRKRGIPSAFSKERIIALFLVFIDRHFWRETFAEDFYMLAVLGYFKGGYTDTSILNIRIPHTEPVALHAESFGEQCSVFYMI
jgi:hypothetical protein